MDGLDAGVMETPEVETPELDVEIESPELEAPEAETPEAPEQATTDEADNPYTTKFSRDYRAFLNTLKTTNPEAAKFVKQAKDDYARLYELKRIEGRGIDGIRERYATLDGLSHGELKGVEALTAIQDRVREAEEVDSYILNGDPKAFAGMGPEFDAGLAKLAPAYLDRLAKNPEAFQAAILPHVVGQLQQSPVLEQFNYLVDVLNGKYGRLDDATKLERTYDALRQMGEGFNGLGQKAQQAKLPAAADPKASEFEQERTKFEQERQTHHWQTKIEPLVDSQRQKLFNQFFDPYQKRLKLNDTGTKALATSFRQGIIDAARNDKDFQRQYKAFKSQKSPDPTTVSNYVNAWMGQRAKAIVDAQVSERYGNFLNAKPKAVPIQQRPGTANRGPVAPNVEVRSVKPPMEEIDHRNTPLEWTASSYPGGKMYRLYSGKVVQVRSTV
jgi:hypothetical protein